MNIRAAGLVAALALSILPLGAQAQQSTFNTGPARVEYTQQVATSFYVPMRDGTRIAISLHRPSVNGVPVETPLPVIWHHALNIEEAGVRDTDGANTGPGDRSPLSDLTRQGYVVAIAARRGNGASFGTRRGYADSTESFDAYEITEWLADQPWSTGNIGIYGCSNTGEAAMHAIRSRPPSLKAVFAGCFAWDRFDGHTRGAIIANYGTGPTRTLEDDMQATPVQGDEDRILLRQAAEEHLASTNLFALMQSMPYRDSFSPLVMSKFWGEVSIGAYLDQVRQSGVALYIQGGWHDDFRTEGFTALANLPGQARMIIGPWRHCINPGFDLRAEQVRFFDHYLKGMDTGIDRDEPIQYFTINAPEGQQWRSAAQWPLPDTDNQRLFLAGEALQAAASARTTARSVAVDYAVVCPPDPIQPNGGPFTQPCHPSSGVTFTGRAFRTDTEVTGNPVIDVWVSSNAPEQPVFAYLEDVAPDGTITVISDGRQRASLRQVVRAPWNTMGLPWRRAWAEDHEPLVEGVPVKVSFDLMAVSYVFKAGHRLQVSVSGSEPRERGRAEVQAPVLTVHSGGDLASSIVIPFRPSAR